MSNVFFRLSYTEELQCTILEVKAIGGFGTTTNTAGGGLFGGGAKPGGLFGGTSTGFGGGTGFGASTGFGTSAATGIHL